MGEYISDHDQQLKNAKSKIRKFQKVSENLKSEKAELATANGNLKKDLEHNNDQVTMLTKENAELKRALDEKKPNQGIVTEICIGCNKQMVLHFRELAFCSTDCVRLVALKLKGAESFRGAVLTPSRPKKN